MQKKKSLGQYFLHSAFYLDAAADAADIKKGEAVLEVGPGDGALTSVLLARGARVVAVEKDCRLVPLLRERFKNFDVSRFQVTEADALDFNISGLKNFNTKNFKVVGNIPYYITGALLKKFLSAKNQPSLLVFLVQKEVAERVACRERSRTARSKKESKLSLSVKAYGHPKIIKTVPRGAFSPSPNVDSAILQIKNISKKNFKNSAHEKKFFELLRAGFGKKRKLLRNNVKPVLGKNYSSILQNTGIEKTARAEDVALAQWLALSKY